MTSPNRKPSLEDVLDALFQQDEAPTPEMIVQACQAHAEYRDELLEFAALLAAQAALPEPAASDLEVSENSVMQLQSRVLNRLYGTENTPAEAEAVRLALASLAGHRLKAAAQAAGLGSTVLLQKVLTRSIFDTPRSVLAALASFLEVSAAALSRALGPQLALHRSYKATDKPTVAACESWAQAVASLNANREEKSRLLALQNQDVQV